jgi:hypothetical protein
MVQASGIGQWHSVEAIAIQPQVYLLISCRPNDHHNSGPPWRSHRLNLPLPRGSVSFEQPSPGFRPATDEQQRPIGPTPGGGRLRHIELGSGRYDSRERRLFTKKGWR